MSNQIKPQEVFNMNMTLEQYVVNPMGKSNAVLNATAREAIISDYKKRYGRLMIREHSNILYYFYKDDKKNIYVAHFKIPSETVKNFYYDVVFEFTADENITNNGLDLLKYNCRFFSNDPAFVYSYAYVFIKNGLIIDQLKSKLSRKTKTSAPDSTNSGYNVGYVKSIYFAYLYFKSRGLNNKDIFSGQASKLSYSKLKNEVMDADDKIFLRQEAGMTQREVEREAKKQAKMDEEARKKASESKKVNKINKITGNKSNIKPITGKGKIGPKMSNRTK